MQHDLVKKSITRRLHLRNLRRPGSPQRAVFKGIIIRRETSRLVKRFGIFRHLDWFQGGQFSMPISLPLRTHEFHRDRFPL